MSGQKARLITLDEQLLLQRIAPRQHDWKHTEEGTPTCANCRLWPDDPWVAICGGWKSGQCWGDRGPDFVMHFVTQGLSVPRPVPGEPFHWSCGGIHDEDARPDDPGQVGTVDDRVYLIDQEGIHEVKKEDDDG